jgi:hypothetical protein
MFERIGPVSHSDNGMPDGQPADVAPERNVRPSGGQPVVQPTGQPATPGDDDLGQRPAGNALPSSNCDVPPAQAVESTTAATDRPLEVHVAVALTSERESRDAGRSRLFAELAEWARGDGRPADPSDGPSPLLPLVAIVAAEQLAQVLLSRRPASSLRNR